jgi:capsular polysaccharide biosynthesis protein
MSNETTQDNKQIISNDEIDLLLLASKVVDLFKRRYKILILSLIIGSGMGLSSYYSQKPLYKSTLIGNSEILRNEYVTLLFKNLNDLLKEGNYVSLASYLKVSEENAKNIVKIEASPVVLKEVKDDKLVNTFQIDVITLDPMQLDTIQKGIIFYIQNNDFVKKRVNLQRSFMQNMIAKMELEINEMGAMRDAIFKGKGNGERITLMDPSSINNSIVNLYEKKLTLQNAIETLNQVLIIQNFIKYEKPVSPKISIYVPAGISTGLIIGCVIIFILEARRKILK